MKFWHLVSIIILLLFVSGCSLVYGPLTEATVSNVEINKAERVCTSNGENTNCTYLVFTDKGTFKNSDSLYGLKYNSSDLHGIFNKGTICDFKVIGWRNKIFSMYQNIIEANCGGKNE